MYAGWLVYNNLATSSLKNDANSTQEVSLLRSETNVKFLSFECPIGSVYGIFTYIYHKNPPNLGKIYQSHWILWVPWSTNRQMTRFAYGILLATMVQFLALGWYGLVSCSSYDGVKAETFRDCGVDSQAVLFFFCCF